jgi:hypothetical protein
MTANANKSTTIFTMAITYHAPSPSPSATFALVRRAWTPCGLAEVAKHRDDERERGDDDVYESKHEPPFQYRGETVREMPKTEARGWRVRPPSESVDA